MNKPNLLTVYLATAVNKTICKKTTYDDAITVLKTFFVKPKKEMYACHKLVTAFQN